MSTAPFEDPRPVSDVSKAPAPPAVEAAGDATLSDSWVTIRKRKWLILGFGVLGAIYGTYQGVTQPRLYDAYGTIEIRSGSSNEYRLSSGVVGDNGSRLTTEIVILKSDSLMLSVARDLNLANNPDFGGGGGYSNIDDPVIRNRIVGSLQGSLAIAMIPKTDLIRIDCFTGNAKLSAMIVNKLVQDYIERSFQTRADATKRVSNFFSTQLEDLRQEVQTSQEQMLDLQKKLGVLAFDPAHNQITAGLDGLSAAANTAELARINAETRYRVLSTMDRNSLDQASTTTAAGGPIAGIRGQIESIRSNLASLNTTLGPKNPRVVALNTQLAELNVELQEEEDRIISGSKQVYLAAQADEDQTRLALDEAKKSAFDLRDDLLKYSVSQREFESNRTLYEGLMQRLRTAGVEAGLESTEIDIVDPAVPPLGPLLKAKNSMIIVNASIMLVVGIILAFILDSLDTGLSSVAEVEAVSGLPSLALILRSAPTSVRPCGISAPSPVPSRNSPRPSGRCELRCFSPMPEPLQRRSCSPAQPPQKARPPSRSTSPASSRRVAFAFSSSTPIFAVRPCITASASTAR
jgi:succinoglycan biosynthesis transport protein ExoP